MAAGVRVARVGALVSRNIRSVIPVIVLAFYSLAIPRQSVLGSQAIEHVKDMVALAFALGGLTLRAVVLGSFCNAESGISDLRSGGLRTKGLYALTRNPLHLGSLLVCFGIFLMHGSLHVLLMGMLACVLVYDLIARAEEEDLLSRFGAAYRAYGARTPRWLPSLGQLSRVRGGPAFDARRAIAHDWPLILGTICILWLTEYYEYLPDPVASLSQLYLMGFSVFAVVGAVVAIVLQANRVDGPAQPATAEALDVTAVSTGSPAPETLGRLVEGRVRSVDILEDMISFGHQEDILMATLDAADLKPGERLVDVGCGSGKLVIAAALRNRSAGVRHAAGDLLGIDATSGMIDLAVERALDAGAKASFQVGVAEALPVADESVDAVTSSYFFHHLPSHVKPQALNEMWRVLKPGGRLVITDYGRAHGVLGMIASFPMRFNFYEYVRPQLNGELEKIVAGEGIGPFTIERRFLGYITVMKIVKPDAPR